MFCVKRVFSSLFSLPIIRLLYCLDCIFIYLYLSYIIMALIFFCIWLVSHLFMCSLHLSYEVCACVCVYNASLYQQKHYYRNWIMTQCLPIMLFGTAVLSGVNAFALSAHLGSVLVLMNLISDQPTLLHDTTVYFDMFFIACTVFSLFLYSFNHINSCVWSMLSTTTGVSDSN